jgi:hypothetical protein
MAESGLLSPHVAANVTAVLEGFGATALSDLPELDAEDRAALLAAVPKLKRKAFLERFACVPAVAAVAAKVCASVLLRPRHFLLFSFGTFKPKTFHCHLFALCSQAAQAAEAQQAQAEEKRKRAEAAGALVSEACKEAGHPLSSRRCSTSSNGQMCEAGEVGEVVGISADGQLRVKFSKGTWLFTKEQLVAAEAWLAAVRTCTTHTAALKFVVSVHDAHLD